MSEVRGIDRWTLYVGIEMGCEADRGLYDGIKFMPVVYHSNESKANCTLNTLSIFSKAMVDKAEFICHVENDILLSPDYIEYFEVLIRQYGSDPSIFSINAYTDNEDVEHKYNVYHRNWMTCWGVGFAKRQMSELLADCMQRDLQEVVNNGWDCHAQIYTRRGRPCIHPFFSRCLHIGEEGLHEEYRGFDPAMVEENRTWGGNDPTIMSEPTTSLMGRRPVKETEYIRVKEWSPE